MKFQMFFQKKWISYVKSFSSYWLQKICLFKSILGFFSENALALNVVTSPKNSWNMHKNTFVLLFHESEPNWVKKSYCYSDLRFKDSFVTGWLPTTSIVAVIERIYGYQFKPNYLKKHKLFPVLYLRFWNVHEIPNVLKKKLILIGQLFPNLLTPKNVLI